jgi:hypothetical protein
VGRVTTSGQFSEFPVANNSDIGEPTGPRQIVSSGGSLWFLTDIGETLDRISTAGVLTPIDFNLINNADGLAPASDGGVWREMTNGDTQDADDGIEQVSPVGTVAS